MQTLRMCSIFNLQNKKHPCWVLFLFRGTKTFAIGKSKHTPSKTAPSRTVFAVPTGYGRAFESFRKAA